MYIPNTVEYTRLIPPVRPFQNGFWNCCTRSTNNSGKNPPDDGLFVATIADGLAFREVGLALAFRELGPGLALAFRELGPELGPGLLPRLYAPTEYKSW